MKLVAQHVAHQDDDCTFELDEYRDAEGHQMLLAHLRVHKWSREAAKRIMGKWKLFRECVRAPLFASPMDDDDPRWHKFVTLMGWKPFSKVCCNDGLERPLYIHEINGSSTQEKAGG